MSKILSQAGNSLADIYDVEGSIAGIDTLETTELPIVHEAGATVFSERFATSSQRIVTGDIAQNITFGVINTTLPGAVTRLLALAVISDNQARIAQCTVSVRHVTPGVQEIPIWNFALGASEVARFVDDGTIGAFDLMTPQPGSFFFPNFIGGSAQTNPDMTQEIALRGLTTGFGAGTVFVNVILYFAFPFVVGTRSRGLPIPSW